MWSYLKQFFDNDKSHRCGIFKSNTSLMDLPENVLENIFKYLELKQQLELASMNEHFNTIMQNVWRYSDQEAFLKIDSSLSKKKLRSILMQTHQYLEKIQMHACNIEQWNIVKRYKYPMTKELSINTYSQYISPFPDISDLFPNLKSLSIFDLLGRWVMGDRDINHLIKLKSLEVLKISGIFTFNSFQNVFEELKLKSLDASGIQGPFQWTSMKAFENFCALQRFQTRNNWSMLQPNILKLTNLKEIRGFDYSYGNELKEIFRDIVEHKPHNITKIILGSKWSLKYLLRHTFPNLRRLEIVNQNMNEFTDVFKCAPNLREIVFFRCGNMQEEHIKGILKSTQIECFGVNECNCKFETISIDVNDIVKGRTKPLSFHISGWLLPEVVTSFHDSLKIECKFEGESPLFKKMEMVDRNRGFGHYGVEFK